MATTKKTSKKKSDGRNKSADAPQPSQDAAKAKDSSTKRTVRAAEEQRRDDTAAKTAEDAERELEPIFVFVIGDTRLGLPASAVQSILSTPHPVPLPRAPSHILGLIPFGDGALPVVDLASFLGLDSDSFEGLHAEVEGRMMVINEDNMSVGILCQQVMGVQTVQEQDLSAPELLTGGRLGEFMRFELSRGEFPIGLLDLKTLLEAARVQA